MRSVRGRLPTMRHTRCHAVYGGKMLTFASETSVFFTACDKMKNNIKCKQNHFQFFSIFFSELRMFQFCNGNQICIYFLFKSANAMIQIIYMSTNCNVNGSLYGYSILIELHSAVSITINVSVVDIAEFSPAKPCCGVKIVRISTWMAHAPQTVIACLHVVEFYYKSWHCRSRFLECTSATSLSFFRCDGV